MARNTRKRPGKWKIEIPFHFENRNEMKLLVLSNKGLTTLEGLELSGVTHLYCHHNNLVSLPESLPDTLEFIDCSNNSLTHLPTILPQNLDFLKCSHNNLIALPKLPDKLRALFCDGNKLTCIPFLPQSLKFLNCLNNNLPETNGRKILLQQHNQRRVDLGLEIVDEIENDQEIRHRWALN